MKKIDFLIIADALSRLVERLVLLLNRSVWKTAPMTAPAQMMTVQPYLFWRGLTAQALVLSLFRCATEILQGVHTLKNLCRLPEYTEHRASNKKKIAPAFMKFWS